MVRRLPLVRDISSVPQSRYATPSPIYHPSTASSAAQHDLWKYGTRVSPDMHVDQHVARGDGPIIGLEKACRSRSPLLADARRRDKQRRPANPLYDFSRKPGTATQPRW